jgi:type VI secretion system protein ImpH
MKPPVLEQGHKFEFLQAVRVLERLSPDRKPVGYAGPPSDEAVRFGARQSLSFPASEIQSIVADESGQMPPDMIVNFMGLTGPLGVLPYCYTELLLERIFRKDYTLRDFLDIFNHRTISLFYRASTKYRFLIGYERNPEEGIAQYLSDLAGMGTPALKGRTKITDQIFLFYSGLFNQQPRSAFGLEGMLRDYFQVPTEIEMFIGQWIRMEPGSLTRLGSQNSTLGVDFILGERVWDRQSKFRVKLGPLPLTQICQFFPGSPAFEELVQLIRLYAGIEYDFDVSLVPEIEEASSCQLRSDGEKGARLGWSSWLAKREDKIPMDPIIFACDHDANGTL